jgi:glycosyltransferase involved in cell wall biosynthesis
MTGRPKVSLGVVTYNVERYLAEAFDSILAQDYSDFEVVVSDNQSTDSTWDICQEYARRDPRFRIHRNPTNIGAFRNVQRVIDLSVGEYFRLTAHDDLMAPSLLRRCVEVMDSQPDAVLAFPRTIVIDGAGREVCVWSRDPDLRDPRPARRIGRYVNSWILLSELFGVIRMDALRATQPFGSYVSSDKKLLVELLAQGQFHLIDEPLFYRRIHEENTFGSVRTARAGKGSSVYQWLDPEQANRVPAKYDGPSGDLNRLTMETFRALLHGRQPPLVRLHNAATFLAAWQVKRARITIGRWRRRLTNVPIEAPPWARKAPAE